MSELVSVFTTRWHGIVADDEINQLGSSPAFKALRADCAAHGLKPCSSLVCRHPIKPLAGFCKHSGKGDGLQVMCRECNKRPADVVRASEKRKLAYRDSGVEDEAMPAGMAAKHPEEIAALIVAERKRIEELIKRAEAAADRAEAAAASSSGAGPSNVTNNITIVSRHRPQTRQIHKANRVLPKQRTDTLQTTRVPNL
jgi:hypothetical protein